MSALPKKVVLFTSETIAASGSATSEPFSISSFSGVISYSIKVSGSGTCKLEYLVGPTIDGNYIEPGATASGGNIVTGLSSSSGSSGEVIDSISSPVYADCMKLVVTETGGVNSVTVSLIVYVG